MSFFYFFSLWKEDFQRFFSIYFYLKIQPIIVAPFYPQGSWFEQIWICTPWGSTQVLAFLAKLFLGRRYFPIYSFIKVTHPPPCGCTLPPQLAVRGHDLNTFEFIYTTLGCFITMFSFFDQMFFEQKNFKDFCNFILMKI